VAASRRVTLEDFGSFFLDRKSMVSRVVSNVLIPSNCSCILHPSILLMHASQKSYAPATTWHVFVQTAVGNPNSVVMHQHVRCPCGSGQPSSKIEHGSRSRPRERSKDRPLPIDLIQESHCIPNRDQQWVKGKWPAAIFSVLIHIMPRISSLAGIFCEKTAVDQQRQKSYLRIIVSTRS
jgi:hypothetical protein